MEYNKNKAKGYTLGHDTPLNLHMKKVKELISNVSLAVLERYQAENTWLLIRKIFTLLYSLQLKYKEVYEKNKAQINIAPDAFDIRAAKEAYKNISNVSSHSQQLSGLIFHFIRNEFIPCVPFCSSLTTKRNMRPPRINGFGLWTGPTLSMLPSSTTNRVM